MIAVKKHTLISTLATFASAVTMLTPSICTGSAANADTQNLSKMYSFGSQSNLLATFAEQKVQVIAKEVNTPTRKLVFVSAYPYSGSDTIDLYCYQAYKEQLVMVAFIYVRSLRGRELGFKVSGKDVKVLDGKNAVFTIHDF